MPVRPSRWIAVALLVPAAASAQTLVATVTGSSTGENLGAAAAAAGDVDRDGRADFVLGANGFGHVVSGADGSTIHAFASYGDAVAGGLDLDGDSIPDFAGGESAAGGNAGSVRAFSGGDGSILFTVDGASGDTLGNALDFVGDANGDGVADLLAGAGFAANVRGRAYLLSGVDGSVLFLFEGQPLQLLGTSVSGVGDVDDDGLADVLLGAPGFFGVGSAEIRSGMDGELWLGIPGGGNGFGQAVAGPGDLDDDSVPDAVVGHPSSGIGGVVTAYSGANGAVLHSTAASGSNDRYGTALAELPDLDLDGTAEYLVGAPQAPFGPGGYARALSGATGGTLFAVDGSGDGDHFGQSVASIGDANADGTPDAVVGAPQFFLSNGIGYARVHSTACADSFAGYGTGLAGSGGFVPAIAGSGCTSPGGSYTVDLASGVGGAPGVLLIGVQPVAIPGLGGTLLVLPLALVPFAYSGSTGSPGAGTGSVPLPIPLNAGLYGIHFYFQALDLDPAAPYGVAMTSGLDLTVT